MVMSNDELLSRLNAAVKNITDITDLGDSVLQPAKFDRFVLEMQAATAILPEARFIRMEAQQADIDRTGFVGRILRSGATETGDSRTLSTGEFAKPRFATNKLIANELQAVTGLRDRALRRNIERGNFENILVALFGEAAGRDFEEYALFADKGWSHGDDDVLSKSDGWLKLAAQKVYGRNVAGQLARDFDPSHADYPENLFQALIEALPKQFLGNPGEWRIGVPWEVLDKYRDKLRARNTNLGDTVQTQAVQIAYKGIPIKYVPLLERAKSLDLTNDTVVKRARVEGACAMLYHPDNLVWGVFHELQIEREREAKQRRTDFVLTVEPDMHYEDENAAVAAFIDKANPAEEPS